MATTRYLAGWLARWMDDMRCGFRASKPTEGMQASRQADRLGTAAPPRPPMHLPNAIEQEMGKVTSALRKEGRKAMGGNHLREGAAGTIPPLSSLLCSTPCIQYASSSRVIIYHSDCESNASKLESWLRPIPYGKIRHV